MSDHQRLAELAEEHLWGHFSVLKNDVDGTRVIERGQGCYVWDAEGNRYLDGLAGLFVSQLGHGRPELARAAGNQAATLGYFPIWTYGHPTAIELSAKLAELAPGDLNRVFFTTGGSEAVESAWKLARQYFKLLGQPDRVKVISRNLSYHGTTMGALSITGLESIKTVFEPLVPGAVKVPETNHYRSALQPACRRCHRGGHSSRGPGDGGRRVPRAGAERRRLLCAAPRLLHPGTRDLRPAWGAPGI